MRPKRSPSSPAGSSGEKALANILFGEANPSGKLPITFPKSEDELPHKSIVKPPPGTQPPPGDREAWRRALEGLPAFQTNYDEGLKVGYKWYDAEKKPVLYTKYEYSNLKLTPGDNLTVSFTLKNTGERAGTEIAQVYAALPANTGEPPKRLAGWARVTLSPGESKNATVTIESLFLSIFDTQSHSWRRERGKYTVMVGGSSTDLALKSQIEF